MANCPSEEEQTDTPPTRRMLLDEGVRRLAEAGVKNARREAEWLLAEALRQPRALLYAHPGLAVPAGEAQVFRAWLRRRAGGEPLQYVLGHADFFGLRLKVSPAVLIPRPETEEVVEEALRRLRPARQPTILDVGTGSGCMALALKAQRPDADVHACDVSREALAVARTNAIGLDVHLFHADVLEERSADKWPSGLDLLVSNPPYVPADEAETLPAAVRDYEPAAALFSGRDPLCFYRALARLAPRLLVPGGHLVLETHAHYASAVAALLRASGLEDVAVTTDRAGRGRIAYGCQPLRREQG